MVGAKMFVYFKTASGKFMRLDVPSSACVADVKRLLAARNPEAVGADPACFHLVFRGHQLAENESFMAAGIRSQQLITVEHRAGATIAAVPASPAARPVHGYTPASAAPELPISAARYTAEGSDAAAEQGIHALAAQSSVPEAMRLGHRLSSSNGSVGYCSACAENQGRLTVFEQRVAAQERELAANARELAASVQAIQAHPQFWLRCSGGAMYGAALAAARKPAVVATDQRRADQELERQQRAVQGQMAPMQGQAVPRSLGARLDALEAAARHARPARARARARSVSLSVPLSSWRVTLRHAAGGRRLPRARPSERQRRAAETAGRCWRASRSLSAR